MEKRYRNLLRIFWGSAFIFVVSSWFGCESHEQTGNTIASHTIEIAIEDEEDDASAGTRSEGFSESGITIPTILLNNLNGGDVKLAFKGTEKEMSSLLLFDEVSNDSSSTRALPVTSQNISSSYADKIYLQAFKQDYSEYIPRQRIECTQAATGTNGTSFWKPTQDIYNWPNEDDLNFWAYAPYDVFSPSLTTDKKQMTFSYTTPVSSTDPRTDAEMQKDIVMAQTSANINTSYGRAHMKFKHPLCAIRFEIGRTVACKVKTISLKNVKSKGTCTFTPANSTTPIVWSGLSDAKKLVQAFNQKINKMTDTSGASQPVYKGSKAANSATFMLIPQTSDKSVTDAIEVELVITDEESHEDMTFSSKISADWKAGHLYTYVLSGVGDVLEVKVEDTMAGNVKKDLVISNSSESICSCYIRAMIVGSWFENTTPSGSTPTPGKVLAPWSLSDGTFEPTLPSTVGASGAVNNWILGADGFYYYKYPVYPGKETGVKKNGTGTPDKLFTTYTAPEVAPYKNAYLNVQIVVQSVKWDEKKELVKQAWGTAAAGYLSVTE